MRFVLNLLVRATTAAIAVVPVVLATACGTSADGGDDDGRPLVVVTTTILGDIVQEIAGDAANVETLMPIGADPHEFALSVRQATTMQEADLIVTNGLGFEAGLLDAIGAAADAGAPILDLGEELEARSSDGSNRDLEPHWFTDPVRMADAAGIIGDALSVNVDPSSGITERAQRTEEQLSDLDNEIRAVLNRVPAGRRTLITNHDVLGSFADRYDLTVVDVVIPGGTTLAETGSAALADLVDTIEQAGVPAIFVESSAASDLARAVADEVDGPVAVVELFTESLGPAGSGAETYREMMLTDAERIAEALA